MAISIISIDAMKPKQTSFSSYSNDQVMTKSIQTLFTRTLCTIGILVILYFTYTNWEVLIYHIIHADPLLLLFGLLISLSGAVANSLYFNALLNKFNCQISLKVGIKIYLSSQIARYAPGKVWSIVYQISKISGTLTNNMKSSQALKEITVAVSLTNIEFMMGTLFYTACIAFSLIALKASWIASALIFSIGLFLFAKFHSTNLTINYIKKLIRIIFKKEIPNYSGVKNTKLSSGIFLYITQSTLTTASTIILMMAFFKISFEQILFAVVMHNLAFLISTFIFIIPSGVGVREAIFISTSNFFQTEVSLPELMAMAIILRAWQVLIELLAFLVSLTIPDTTTS